MGSLSPGAPPSDDAAPAETGIRSVLRHLLKERMVARDREAAAVLRSAIAAIENAEAQAADDVSAAEALLAGPGAPGAADVARRHVDDGEARAIVEREVAELDAAATEYGAVGQPDAAAAAARQAEVLRAALVR